MKTTQTINFEKQINVNGNIGVSGLTVEFGKNRKGDDFRSFYGTASSVFYEEGRLFEDGNISIEEFTAIIKAKGYATK